MSSSSGKILPRKSHGSGRLAQALGFEARDKLYARTLKLCLAGSVAAHAFLFFVGGRYIEEPTPFRIIGYEGRLVMLPELSILEERQALIEQRESLAKRGMKVVSFETEEPRPTIKEAFIERRREEEKRRLEERLRQARMRMVARSLAQPRSDALVVRKLVKPVYPAISVANGIEGRVVLNIRIGKTGKVLEAEVVSSEVDQFCEQAAIAAALKCEFKPIMRNGKPVAFWARFPVRFDLSDYFISARRKVNK